MSSMLIDRALSSVARGCFVLVWWICWWAFGGHAVGTWASSAALLTGTQEQGLLHTICFNVSVSLSLFGICLCCWAARVHLCTHTAEAPYK